MTFKPSLILPTIQFLRNYPGKCLGYLLYVAVVVLVFVLINLFFVVHYMGLTLFQVCSRKCDTKSTIGPMNYSLF